jgi:hypothetical protein
MPLEVTIYDSRGRVVDEIKSTARTGGASA